MNIFRMFVVSIIIGLILTSMIAFINFAPLIMLKIAMMFSLLFNFWYVLEAGNNYFKKRYADLNLDLDLKIRK